MTSHRPLPAARIARFALPMLIGLGLLLTSAASADAAVRYHTLRELGFTAKNARVEGRKLTIDVTSKRWVELRLSLVKGRERVPRAWSKLYPVSRGSHRISATLDRRIALDGLRLRVTIRDGHRRARGFRRFAVANVASAAKVSGRPPRDISLSSTTIAENQVIGTVVSQIMAEDPNPNSTFTFALVPGSGSTDNASFTVSGTTLRSAVVFDYEAKSSYAIRLRVTNNRGLSYDEAFTITVTDANDPPANVTLSNATIPENEPAGTVVGILNAVDPDPGSTVTFSLVGGTGSADNGSFAIVGGQLRTAAVFDREAKSSYSIRVAASDGTASTEKQFTITVTNVNEVPTDLTLADAEIAESEPSGTAVGTLSRVDPDAGDSSTFALVSGTGDDDNASFAIAGSSLTSAAVFDFEANSSYSVRVRVTDGGGLTFEKALTITVTNVNEAPTDIALSNATVAESQPAGTAVGALSAADPDAGDTQTFTLAAGAGGGDNGSFAIAGTTLKTTAPLNFEAKSSYSIRVRVTDGGGLTFDEVFTITVTNANDAPTDIALSSASVAENQPSGTTVGLLSGTDEDSLDTLSFSLVSGTGSTDNGSFAISGAMLQTAAALDFEAKSSYSVRVRVSDGNGGTFDEVFAITVTDANDAPSSIGLSPSAVDEGQAVGTTVGTLSAADQDAGDSHTFTLVSGTGSTDNASFQISGSTLNTAAVLDYNAGATRSIRVQASDGNGGTFEQQLTVTVGNINVAPTDIALSPSSVAENASVNTVVGTLSATDPDAGDTHTFSLVTGAGDGDNGSFNVSGSSLRTSAIFNYEAKSTYSIRVQVDDGGATFEKALTVTVTNVNDAPTDIALSNASVTEGQAAGTTVGLLSATDDDPLDAHTFTLVTGAGDTGNTSFQISGATLQTSAVLDFETTSSYSIRVRVSDGNGGSYEKVFTITVLDGNDAPTNIALSSSTVAENQASGTAVGTLSATDPDAGDTHTFTLVSGVGSTDNASFQISGASLQTAAVFDFEAKSSYSIRVRATDSGSLTFEKQLTVTVSNVNEAPTDISLSPSSVAENSAANTVVGALSATDPDAASTHTFSLVSGTGSDDNASFNISGSSLRTSASFDFEAKSSYSIRVRATDGGALTFEKALTVTVTNVNDAPTDIGLSNASVQENTADGTAVGTLSSTDQDAGATHTYSLVSGTGSTDNAKFKIVGGALQRSAVALNYEVQPTASVRIRTTDNGGLTFEKAFTITVVDVNDAPVADDESFSAAQRAIGNTSLVVDDPTDGAPDPTGPQKTVTGDILAGDTDEDGDTLAVVAGTFATNDGGSVDVQADGDFVYHPKADTSCTDHSDFFDYTVTDQNSTKPPGTAGTDTGRVTLDVQDCVWYVDASAAGGGNGTSGTPYNALSNLAGAGGSGDVDDASDKIFLYDGTYSGGLPLEGSQQLFGQRHGLTVPDGGAGNVTIEAAVPAGSPSTISGGVTLASNNTLQGIDLGNATGYALSGSSVGILTVNTQTAGQINNATGGAVDINGGALAMAFSSVSSTNSAAFGIRLQGASGSFTASGGTISNATSADVALSGGSSAFTYDGAITDDVGQLVSISGETGGTKDFNGAISDGGDGDGSGISLSSNTGATVRFDGGLTLATGANAAFAATGGGTVVATDPAGAAANTIATTTGTALNVASTTIGAGGLTFQSIAANGAPSGIVLSNTGASGGLTVSGNSGACATTGDACTGGTIQSTTGDAISLTSTRDVSLTRVKLVNNLGNGIKGSSVTNFSLTDSVVDNNADNAATDEAGLNFTNLGGTASIVRTLVAHQIEDNARIINTSAALTQLNVTDSTFSDTDAGTGNNGLLLQAGTNPGDNGSITADVLGSKFLRSRANGLQVVTNAGGSVNLDVNDNGASQSTFDDNNIGVSIAHNSSGSLQFNVLNSTIDGLDDGSSASPVNLNLGGCATTTMSGTVSSNAITNHNSLVGPGVRIVSNGPAAPACPGPAGTMTVAVTNNSITQVAAQGIQVLARDGSSTINATITGNTVNVNAAGGLDGIRVDSGATSADTTHVCADIRTNNTTAQAGQFGIRIRNRFAGTTFTLEGYGPLATNDSAVAAFLNTNNTSTPAASADHLAGNAGFGTTVNCPTP